MIQLQFISDAEPLIWYEISAQNASFGCAVEMTWDKSIRWTVGLLCSSVYYNVMCRLRHKMLDLVDLAVILFAAASIIHRKILG